MLATQRQSLEQQTCCCSPASLYKCLCEAEAKKHRLLKSETDRWRQRRKREQILHKSKAVVKPSQQYTMTALFRNYLASTTPALESSSPRKNEPWLLAHEVISLAEEFKFKCYDAQVLAGRSRRLLAVLPKNSTSPTISKILIRMRDRLHALVLEFPSTATHPVDREAQLDVLDAMLCKQIPALGPVPKYPLENAIRLLSPHIKKAEAHLIAAIGCISPSLLVLEDELVTTTDKRFSAYFVLEDGLVDSWNSLQLALCGQEKKNIVSCTENTPTELALAAIDPDEMGTICFSDAGFFHALLGLHTSNCFLWCATGDGFGDHMNHHIHLEALVAEVQTLENNERPALTVVFLRYGAQRAAQKLVQAGLPLVLWVRGTLTPRIALDVIEPFLIQAYKGKPDLAASLFKIRCKKYASLECGLCGNEKQQTSIVPKKSNTSKIKGSFPLIERRLSYGLIANVLTNLQCCTSQIFDHQVSKDWLDAFILMCSEHKRFALTDGDTNRMFFCVRSAISRLSGIGFGLVWRLETRDDAATLSSVLALAQNQKCLLIVADNSTLIPPRDQDQCVVVLLSSENQNEATLAVPTTLTSRSDDHEEVYDALRFRILGNKVEGIAEENSAERIARGVEAFLMPHKTDLRLISVFYDESSQCVLRIHAPHLAARLQLRSITLTESFVPRLCELSQLKLELIRNELMDLGFGTCFDLEARPLHTHFDASQSILLRGPAGSGKTWLAALEIQKVLRAGSTALFVSPTISLGFKLIRSLLRSGTDTSKLGLLCGSEYYVPANEEDDEMTLKEAAPAVVSNAFDFIVIDEAHQVGDMSPEQVNALRTRLLSGTRIWLLSDASQSRGLTADSKLASMLGVVQPLKAITFTKVLRCPPRLVEAAETYRLNRAVRLPAVESDVISVPITKDACLGPAVRTYIFETPAEESVYESYARRVAGAIHEAADLLAGASLHLRLCILVPDHEFRRRLFGPLHAALSMPRDKFQLVAASSAWKQRGRKSSSASAEEKQQLIFDVVSEFSGLEVPLVCCVGLDSYIHSDEHPESALDTRCRLYKALTRASYLALVVNEAMRGGWLEWLGHVEFLSEELVMSPTASTERLLLEPRFSLQSGNETIEKVTVTRLSDGPEPRPRATEELALRCAERERPALSVIRGLLFSKAWDTRRNESKSILKAKTASDVDEIVSESGESTTLGSEEGDGVHSNEEIVSELRFAPWSSRLLRVYRGHEGSALGVTALRTPDGIRLASCGEDHTIRLWTSSHEGAVQILRGHESRVNRVTALKGDDEDIPVSCSRDGTARIWRSKSCLILRGHQGRVLGLTCFQTANGEPRLATNSTDRTIRVWDAVEENKEALLVVATGLVYDIKSLVLDDVPWLCGGTLQGELRLWRADNGDPAPVSLGRHDDRVNALAVAGTMVASGSNDATVGVWELAKASGPDSPPLALLAGHSDAVVALDFLPRTPLLLASGSLDATIRIWNPANGGSCLRLIHGHLNHVTAITAFADEHKRIRLASASSDATVRLWDLADDNDDLDEIAL